ncbi:MAG: formyltransferase family protein [Proteobacteria bacterium]|nr:formyltransferase family protein [Pseudomonadota bacterium]MDA1023560.1 formyltransferase family protein [Pseudomonadota bacterium]
MPEEIILLTGEVEGPHFRAMLENSNPALKVVHAETLAALKDACAVPPPGGGLRRLIAFSTHILVPGYILDALGAPAYNFHPGPPTYPGSHAASFAIYEGAEKFAATAHVMEHKVDCGPIVAVEWFAIPEKAKFMDLELKTYEVLLRVFSGLAPHLAGDDTPLPVLDVQWSGPKRTNAQFDAMKEIEADMEEEELRLRFRAFG